MSGADRTRRHRARRAAGQITLTITLDELEAIDVLTATRQLSSGCDPSKRDLEQAIESLFRLLWRDRYGDALQRP